MEKIENVAKQRTVNYKQETQLSQSNRATRLQVSQGHQTCYHSIFIYLFIYCLPEIINVTISCKQA